jgi:cyclase
MISNREVIMERKKVGSRGTLFTFYDLGIPTNIYVINAQRHVYIVDTYLGPDIMKLIDQYIKSQLGNKSIIVVNSHSHWDHVWGNSFYKSSIIIAHVLCKQYMERDGLENLEKNKGYKKGEVILKYPNLTFTDEICFEEDNVLIYYTPGHTDDEISIIDLEDKVLFAGDNLERPIPYLMSKNLNQYIKTLEDYVRLNVEVIIGGHTSCENKNLILDNLYYVKQVLIEHTEEFEKDKYAQYHKTNMEWLSN